MSTSARQTPLSLALLPLLAIYAGAVVLTLITRASPAGMIAYWEVFAVLVALLSLVWGWGQTYANDRSSLMYLAKQIVYWGALFGLLALLHQHGAVGTLSPVNQSVVLLYLLGMTALFVSISVDARLFFFALFLIFCGYLLAVPQNNLVLVELGKFFRIANAAGQPVSMLIGVAVALCVASLLVLLNVRGAIASKNARD